MSFSILTAGLGAIASGLIGHATAKACDQGYGKIEDFITNRTIDANHDIERAILSAHYRSLEFVIKAAIDHHGLDPFSGNANNAQSRLKSQLQMISKENFAEHAPDIAKNWQDVVPDSFASNSDDLAILSNYLATAELDLKDLTNWSAGNWAMIEVAVKHPTHGWAPLFKAKLHEALKKDGPFKNIYTQHVLQSQSKKLDDILTFMMPTNELCTWMDGIDDKLFVITETGLDTHENTKIILARMDRLEKLVSNAYSSSSETFGTENQYDSSFTRKEFEKLHQPTNLPAEIEKNRKLIIEYIENENFGEAESLLNQLAEHQEKQFENHHAAFEQASLDRAQILAFQAMVAGAKGNLKAKMDFYCKAAQSIQIFDVEKSWQWLIDAGDNGYSYSIVSGNAEMLDTAIRIYQQALELVSTTSSCETPKPDYRREWAETNNKIGDAYLTQGIRGYE